MAETAEQKIVDALEKLKSANLRLRVAMDATVQSWPNAVKCWVDSISEPTVLLTKHHIPTKPNGG